MYLKILVGIYCVLSVYRCVQPLPKNQPIGGIQESFEIQNILHVDNGINRGTDYTDSLGEQYSLRYIPVSIRNDRSKPLVIQISFLPKYTYSVESVVERFKIIPLPESWVLEGAKITDNMLVDLKQYILRSTMTFTLGPFEKYTIGIGTLYPKPSKLSGILPKVLFGSSQSEFNSACKWIASDEASSQTAIPLWLKLVYSESCMVVRSGQILTQIYD